MALTHWWRVALAGLFAVASNSASATLFTITANTNWNAIAGGPPTAADTILVKNGATLTVNVASAVVGAITLGGGAPSGGQGTLSFSANTSTVTISTASGQAGTLTLGSGGQNGNLNMANGGTLTLAGFVSSNVGTFTRGTGTIVLTGTNTLPTAGAYNTYNNLGVSANTTSLGQNTTVAGNLDVSGGTLNTSTRTLAVNGTASVAGTLTLTNTTTISGTTSIGGTLNITSATGVKTFTGAVTIDGTWNNTVAGNVFVGDDLTNNGTFTSGTGTYTFNGAAAQTLTGSAGTTSFALFVLNNANGLTLTSHNLTVTTLLTLSAGKITTGPNLVYVSNGSAIGAGAGRFIEGNLKKPIPTGTNVAESFEVGGNSGANYSPLNVTFASVSVAGDITVSTTSGSHPQLASSGLDTTTPAKLNRWWTITNTTVAPTTFSATFTYVATEIDTGATAAAFAAVRFDGSDWDPTTLSGAPTTTSLAISAETGFGDFAIGEVAEYNFNRGTTGRFNAYDPSPLTPTNSLHGFIRTKTAGTAFTLTVIHFNGTATGTQSVNKDSIRVDVMDASNTGGTYTSNCSDAWSVIQTLNTAYTANSPTQDITLTINNSYPSVRIKVTRTSGGTESGCSTDRFAVKPNDLQVQAYDTNWQSAGVNAAADRTLNNSNPSGGNVHAASTSGASTPRPFTLRATGRTSTTATTTNYSGTPTVFSGYPACVLPAGCATGTLSFGSWSPTGGTVSANAHYSEAGTFNVRLEDRTFANVDNADTPIAARTIPQASFPLLVGRFVPDRFVFVSANSPQLQTFGASCAATRSFTYVGKPFWYAAGSAPTATVQAVNAGGAITTNYRGTAVGGLFHLAVAGLSETYSNNSVGPALDCKKSDLSLVCSAANTPAGLDASADNGTALYSAPTNAVLVYDRNTTTPANAYNAKISLTVVATDTSETGTGNPGASGLTTPSPLVFNGGGTGIAFDGADFNAVSALTGGKTFVYGRLRMVNAYGSHTVALPVGIETQYWNGSAFQLNSQDNCTTLARSAIALGSYRPNLDPCETAMTQATVSFTQGAGRLYLAAPGAAALTGGAGTPIAGSVQLTANLGATATGNYCPAVGVAEAVAVTANQAYLQGAWTGTNFTEDPSARATFGFYSTQPRNFIYFRENY